MQELQCIGGTLHLTSSWLVLSYTWHFYCSNSLTVLPTLQTLGSALKLPILSLTAAAQLLTTGMFLAVLHMTLMCCGTLPVTALSQQLDQMCANSIVTLVCS